MSYIDELERELIRAGREYQGRRVRLRVAGGRPRFGQSFRSAFAVIASTAIVVAVVLTIGLLGHRRGPTNQPAEGNAKQLQSMLAVLRRPQTPADRAVSQSEVRFLELNVGKLVPSLTRRVGTIGRARIFMFVTKASVPRVPFPNGPLWSPALGDRVFIASASASAPGFPVPAADLHDPQNASSFYVEASTQKPYFLGIVPDGVARTRIVFRGGTALDERPSNNVVIVPAPRSSNQQVQSITWYGPDGRVIPTVTPSTDTLFKQGIAARTASIRSTVLDQKARVPDRAPPQLLRSFDVFSADTRRTVTASGLTISHPSLSSLPFIVLQLIDNPRQLRQVTTTSGLRFWVDPGPAVVAGQGPRTEISLRVEQSPSAGNFSHRITTVLASGLFAAAKLHSGEVVIYGILPNTNRTVTLRLNRGGTRTVPVVHGVLVTPAAGVSAILVRSSDGKKVSLVRAPKPLIL